MSSSAMSFIKKWTGVNAGEEAASYYADMVVEGETVGGFKGFRMQALGWTGGLFASLWTPDTALDTAMTLGPGVAALGARVFLRAGWLSYAVKGPWRPIGNTWKLLKNPRTKYTLKNIVYDNRKFKAVSGQYWRVTKGAHGKHLHHLFGQNHTKWIPQGLKNCGLNLLEVPGPLNSWMGGMLAREVGFRIGVISLLTSTTYAGYRFGSFLSMISLMRIKEVFLIVFVNCNLWTNQGLVAIRQKQPLG